MSECNKRTQWIASMTHYVSNVTMQAIWSTPMHIHDKYVIHTAGYSECTPMTHCGEHTFIYNFNFCDLFKNRSHQSNLMYINAHLKGYDIALPLVRTEFIDLSVFHEHMYDVHCTHILHGVYKIYTNSTVPCVLNFSLVTYLSQVIPLVLFTVEATFTYDGINNTRNSFT
jgi:hypothetical protein